jgi:hypothetical protein
MEVSMRPHTRSPLATAALLVLVAELPGLRLATDAPEWRETLTLRGLKGLPVEF